MSFGFIDYDAIANIALAKKIIRSKGLNLVVSSTGIASRIDSDIIINIRLFRYADYLEEVVDHELRHSSKFTKRDFFMDLVEGDLWKNLKFCLRHPSGFLHLFPIGWYKGKMWIDINLLLNYAIVLVLIGIIINVVIL